MNPFWQILKGLKQNNLTDFGLFLHEIFLNFKTYGCHFEKRKKPISVRDSKKLTCVRDSPKTPHCRGPREISKTVPMRKI